MKKLAILAVAGLMSVTASAVDWVLVSKVDGIDFYIDSESISSSGKYKTAFVRNTHNPPHRPTPFITIDRALALQRYDCKSNPRKFQVLSVNAFHNNVIVSSAGYDENAEWNVIYPGTVANIQADFICSR